MEEMVCILYSKNLICIFVEIENNDETIKLIDEAKTLSDTIPLIVLSNFPKRTLFIKALD